MRNHGKLLLLIFITVILTAAFFAPLSKRLCVTDAKTSDYILIFEKGIEEFSISYTHSVNRGRVKDTYLINGGNICLLRTNFVSYGAGMPEPEDGQVFKKNQDSLEISNINLTMKDLILQTGIIADHHIEGGSKTIIFNELVPSQSRVIIGMRRVSLFDMIKLRKEAF